MLVSLDKTQYIIFFPLGHARYHGIWTWLVFLFLGIHIFAIEGLGLCLSIDWDTASCESICILTSYAPI